MRKYYRQTPKANDRNILDQANEEILRLANDRRLSDLPSLSSNIVADCGCDINKIALAIIAYRIRNNFENQITVPSPSVVVKPSINGSQPNIE